MTDIIAELDGNGRRVLVRALMHHTEFVDHWYAVMADWLNVDRRLRESEAGCWSSDNGFGNNRCYAEFITSHSPTATYDPNAFNFSLEDPWAPDDGVECGGAAGGWSPPGWDPPPLSEPQPPGMKSVVRSALWADRIDAVYQSELFSKVSHPREGNDISEQNRREALATGFLETYANRQLDCLSCHNSKWSATGIDSGWKRTFALEGYFEKAVLGHHAGRDPRDIAAVFRTTTSSSAPQPGGGEEDYVAAGITGNVTAWGMNDACGAFAAPDLVGEDTYASAWTRSDEPIPAYLADILQDTPDGNPLRTSVWSLERTLRRGMDRLREVGLVRLPDQNLACDSCEDAIGVDDFGDTQDASGTIANAGCLGCHGAIGESAEPYMLWGAALNSGDNNQPADGWPSTLIRQMATTANMPLIDPGHPENSYLVQIVENGGMPPYPITPEARNQYVQELGDWISELPAESGCDQCAEEADGEHLALEPAAALAHLVAQRVVSNTWEEVYGAELHVDHNLPRNWSQHYVLKELTENYFLKRGKNGRRTHWSLKRVLEELLVSPLNNRKRHSEFDGNGSEFELPLVLDPWVAAHPDADAPIDARLNADTEAIRRHRPRTLFHSLASALQWPEPDVFPNGEEYYPGYDLYEAVGQYIEESAPGSRDLYFQGLVAWEAFAGECKHPQGSADWIDGLLVRANADQSTTYRDVVVALKSRLIGVGTVANAVGLPVEGEEPEKTEEELLEVLFDTASLDNLVPDAGALQEPLRQYCGAILTSPQFLLQGYEPPSAGPRPELAEDRYKQSCENLQPAFQRLGYKLECWNGSLHVERADPFALDLVGTLCPANICGALDLDPNSLNECIINPMACFGGFDFGDIRSIGFGLAGLPTADIRVDRPVALLADWDGAKVLHASGVAWMSDKSTDFKELYKGQVIEAGTWFRIEPGAQLQLLRGTQVYATPSGGMPMHPGLNGPKTTEPQPWLFAVPHEPKPPTTEPLFESKVPTHLVTAMRRSDAFKWGAAGAPVSGPVCGDGSCDTGEDAKNCPADCGGCSTTTCGGSADGCWCDAACVKYGDCCANACAVCGSCQ